MLNLGINQNLRVNLVIYTTWSKIYTFILEYTNILFYQFILFIIKNIQNVLYHPSLVTMRIPHAGGKLETPLFTHPNSKRYDQMVFWGERRSSCSLV